MAQHIYDDEGFFSAYSELPRSVLGLAGAPEWPALAMLLPDVAGRRVVDLGCGFGWFCRWAAEMGARSVLGIDVSWRMLDRARADTDSSCVVYQQCDLEAIELDHGSFDLAFSSLALHYVTDLVALVGQVSRALVPGGRFVFSVEHPIFTAPTSPQFIDGPDATPVWALDKYLMEGERTTDWLAPEVHKRHRTIGTYLAILRGAGLGLIDLVEWGPTAEQLAQNPEWHSERDRPPFLFIAAELIAP